MAAICRFGMRVVPNISEIIEQCRNKKQLVQGPHIAEFEQEFLRVLGGRGHVRAVSTEYGRMALYFILKALDIPAGSEIIVPALTFRVVPEITRVAGLKPVFADIDPTTYTMDPKAAERAITPNTRVTRYVNHAPAGRTSQGNDFSGEGDFFGLHKMLLVKTL